MKSLRLGIIGLGNMGMVHAQAIVAGKVERCELAAVSNLDPSSGERLPGVPFYLDGTELIRSGKCDAVIIATPHFSHPDLGIVALRNGLHVLMEKPLAVQKADCERMLAAHTNDTLVFAAMFNQRTDPFYQKLRELVRTDELGTLRRVQWTITNWFRTEAYYRSGGWRATWGGEGGGVLLNQCPHNLDLWVWMFGMPQRLRAFCSYGRYHDIEVEDDVTAYLEYGDGITGIFITSTGEAPGTNRLEVVGERGKVVYENDQLRFTRNDIPMGEFSKSSKEGFASPPNHEEIIVCEGHGGQHLEIIENFVAAILDKKPLIAPAADGIHSVELANAMLLSSDCGGTVELPMPSEKYADWLDAKVATSIFRRTG